MVFENLIALWIAIEKECPPEVAFKCLDKYMCNQLVAERPKFAWTDDDMEDILKLREEGLTLREIGSYYGVSDQALHKAIIRYREKMIEVSKEGVV